MIRIRRFRWSDFRDVLSILQGAFSGFYETFSLDEFNTPRSLYFRLRFGRPIARIKQVLLDQSPASFFDSAHDPVILVAETPEMKVVGVALLSNIAKTVWSLDQIAVLPEYQRQGVGTRLVKEAIAHIKANGGKTITLTTARDKANLVKFYLDLGFTISNEVRMSYSMK
jgi:ribosomal protein S18 acetylase RimI-like enzyme